jgi:hypothetical protein
VFRLSFAVQVRNAVTVDGSAEQGGDLRIYGGQSGDTLVFI